MSSLQSLWVHCLQAVNTTFGAGTKLRRVDWLRDQGLHGGGFRYVSGDEDQFNRAALNVSAVHYDDDPARKLQSATALSCIVHPDSPRAPSLHTHLSWTEIRGRPGTWRIMADLNPSLEAPEQERTFTERLNKVASEHLPSARAQGDHYFFIPALGRHRGVVHFYLEGHATENPEVDFDFAKSFGVAVIRSYASLLATELSRKEPLRDDARQKQLDYHTLYFFQVLTMDRGTTSGILVHNQNDLGIMGSLPHRVNIGLLESWVPSLPEPQDLLLRQLIGALSCDGTVATVDDATRVKLAEVVRSHYRRNPEALKLQAKGFVTPPTVSNHLD